MANKFYRKGARLERAVVNYAREKGLTSLRSAGSHSKIDAVVIDKKHKFIYFIQGKAKKKKLSENARQKILELLPENDEYMTKRLVLRNLKEFKRILEQDAQPNPQQDIEDTENLDKIKIMQPRACKRKKSITENISEDVKTKENNANGENYIAKTNDITINNEKNSELPHPKS